MKTMNPANPAAQNICPYDVGDILQTTNAKHPAERWPGTVWNAMTGFLYGTNQAIGQSGGNSTVTIQTQNLPKTLPVQWDSGSGQPGDVARLTGSAVLLGSAAAAGTASIQISSANTPISIMPPHTNVYVWQRTV